MTQNSTRLLRGLATLATVFTLLSSSAVGQDDAPDPAPAEPSATPAPAPAPAPTPAPPVDRIRFHVDASNWVALPAGLEFEPVLVSDPTTPFGSTIDDVDFGTESSGRYGLGIEFPHGHGEILGTWWSTDSDSETTEATPGDFTFGELLAFPEYAGFSNDGFADGYLATARALLRDFRIDYARPIGSAERPTTRWFVGYRQVRHDRSLAVDYFAFEPLLPPLFPPIVEQPRTGCGPDPNNPQCLDPLPDTAAIASYFEGRGVEAGLLMRVPLIRRHQIWIEGGLTLAALRGDTETEYRSTNAVYLFTDPTAPPGTPPVVLNPPYDELNDPVAVQFVSQGTRAVALSTTSRSTNASVIEAELGLRWRFWKTFDLFGGYRSSRYDDVGVDLRLDAPSGPNRQAIVEESHSVYYEGFFFGLTLGF